MIFNDHLQLPLKWPRCKNSNNIIIDFVEIEVVNIDLTEIVLVIIDLYYNIELIETRRCI